MGSREHISESAVLQPGMNEGKSKYVTAPVMPKGARARQEMRSKVGAEPVWRKEPQCTPASCPCSWGECVCWLQPLPDCKGYGDRGTALGDGPPGSRSNGTGMGSISCHPGSAGNPADNPRSNSQLGWASWAVPIGQMGPGPGHGPSQECACRRRMELRSHVKGTPSLSSSPFLFAQAAVLHPPASHLLWSSVQGPCSRSP